MTYGVLWVGHPCISYIAAELHCTAELFVRKIAMKLSFVNRPKDYLLEELHCLHSDLSKVLARTKLLEGSVLNDPSKP